MARRRLSQLAITLTAFMALAAIASPVWAQEAGDQEKPAPVRALKIKKKLTDGEFVVIHKGDGWVFGEAPKGSIAMLRAAGEESSQMEVRYTPNIKKDKLKSHLTSFHASLKQTGLTQVSTKPNKLSELFPDGIETEYALTTSGKKYRLIVWTVHRKDGVWFVTGFFPENARDTHYAAFVSLVQSIQFE